MRHLTISCLALCAVNLSGCAQIVNFGDILWSETKSLTHSSKDKLMAALRPRSERTDPIFINDPTLARYETVHTPAHNYAARNNPARIDIANSDIAKSGSFNGLEPLPSHPNNHLANTQMAHTQIAHAQIANQAPIYSTQPNTQYSYADTAAQPLMAGVDIADMSQELPDLSYVRLVGRTSAADWQECQAQAGGYILADNTGFHVRPEFEHCMRAKGYVPESEAVGFMDAQLLP